MKIDFSQVLLSFTGEPFQLEEGGADLTLKDATIRACKTPIPGDEKLTFEEKIIVDNIGLAAFTDATEIEMDQAKIIKDRISVILNAPAIAGAVRRAIG